MKKRILNGFVALLIVGLLVLGTIPVPTRAADSQEVPTLLEELDSGWERVSPTITQRTVGVDGTDVVVEYAVTSIPITLEDNKTLIDNKWYYKTDPSGQSWFESGKNTFMARVTKDKISVLDKNGRLTNHTSVLSMENSYKGGTPQIANDPLNDQEGTALAWDYGSYGKGSNLKRYLRSNNGRLSELWVLTGKPTTSLVFRPNIVQEKDFEAQTTPMIAFDAEYHTIPVVANLQRGFYVVDPAHLENVVYPVYIDPTYDFTWWSDAWVQAYGSTYSTVNSAASGTLINGDFPAWIGQEYWYNTYYVNHSYVIFPTTTIPTNLNIMTAAIYLWGYMDESDTDFNIVVCNGQPTYPSSPPVASDFYRGYYTPDNGSGKSTASGWYTSYNIVYINNTGFINKGGFTKLALRSDRDISQITPYGDERVAFWQGEHGSSTAPQLRVIGTIPVTMPDVTTNAATGITTTSATLNGYLIDDGDGSCSVQFQYGLTTAYGYTTAWDAGYESGDSFSTTVAGLQPGVTYHFRAVATNSSGTDYGTDRTFVTAPMPPTYFTATEGDEEVELSWTKGTGANKTVIVRKTGSYPSSPADGTTVYNSVGMEHVDDSLTNDTTYYYRAWSLASDNSTYSTTYAQDYARPTSAGEPSVVTVSASSITVDGATLNGDLVDLGGYANATVYFQYGKTEGYGNFTVPQVMSAPTIFEADLIELDSDTLYNFRAVAETDGGTAYGVNKTFTTGDVGAPTMTTNAATGVQITAAQLNGTVTSDGGAPPVTVWFQYGLTLQYELGETPTAAGMATGGTFYYGLGGLTSNTEYHYRAVGQNSHGVAYGADQTFTTSSASSPTVVTNDATSIGAAQATLQGTLSSAGGMTCELSFEYGLDETLGTTITATPNTGSSGTSFSAIITGLETDTLYYYRAKAVNNGGTGEGDIKSFTTVFTAPTQFTAIAISSTTINLSWVAQGDQTFINYKTAGYPVDRTDGTEVYFGANTYATLSGLEAGTTYYFSAWSWKVGDVWTTTNANAIATTYASSGAGNIPKPTVPTGEEPVMPTSWFDIPTNAVIRNFPLYDIVTGWATAYEVPEGPFWAFASLIASVVVGAIAFVAFRQAIPAVAGSLVVIVIAGFIHACPPILAIFVGAIEIGGGYGLMSLGANVSGRGGT